jgi:hypothetical protein
MLRFTFNLILLLSLVLISCADIPRDNILDPKNLSSTRSQIISIEAFVNTSSDIPPEIDYNYQLIDALNQLENKYRDKIIILEYHRNVQEYIDPDYSIENESLYSKYILHVAPGSKGVPDVFINGTTARIQGAFDAGGTTKIRLEQAIEPLLIRNSHFALEPKIESSSSGYNISVKIARLGENEANNILVKAVYISKDDDSYHQRVVKSISKSNIISKIEAGEVKEVNFPSYQPFDQNRESVIFFVTSEDEVQVYQSIKVDLL